MYPLKILRDFHLRFHLGGAIVPAAALARTLIVHPESSTIVYTSDYFSVRETLFVPVHESGAIIAFEVDTTEPLEIEAIFNRDFQLEWPAAMGGGMEDWDSTLHAFHFGEESGKFDALVGSPSAVKGSEEYSSNYFSSSQDSILLGETRKGTETKLVVIAAGFEGRASLTSLYDHLAKDYPELLRTSAEYYRDYLARTVSLQASRRANRKSVRLGEGEHVARRRARIPSWERAWLPDLTRQVKTSGPVSHGSLAGTRSGLLWRWMRRAIFPLCVTPWTS